MELKKLGSFYTLGNEGVTDSGRSVRVLKPIAFLLIFSSLLHVITSKR